MSQTITSELSEPTALKFYSSRAIAIATFIGGPLAAGYLIRANYLALDQPKKGRQSLIISIVATIILFASMLMIPDAWIDRMPNTVIPVTYTVIAYYLAEHLHGDIFSKYEAVSDAFYSKWKAAGIGLIALIILVLAIIAAAFLEPSNKDVDQYYSNVTTFTEYETQALTIYDRLETDSPISLIEELDTQIIPTWQSNMVLIERNETLDRLPAELAEDNDILIKYAQLRLDSFKLLSKMLAEDDVSYLPEFQKINDQIEEKLVQLS